MLRRRLFRSEVLREWDGEDRGAQGQIGDSTVKRKIAIVAAVLCASGAVLSTDAVAQKTDTWQLSDDWHFGATIYGYLPTIGVKAMLPNGATSDVSVDINQILNHIKMGFMGAAEAQKGRWGAFTDVLYMDVGAAPSRTRSFDLGPGVLPADVSASTTINLKATVWTLAGSYRVVADPAWTFDVLAGARLLDIKYNQDFQLNGNVGPIPIPGRSGNAGISVNDWDAIIGVKGRYALSDDRTWYLPYYVDVGTGASKVTWQILGGVGYAFNWGDIVATWRYLDFRNDSGKPLQNLNMNGPQISFVWHW
jgi:hypothetical protein